MHVCVRAKRAADGNTCKRAALKLDLPCARVLHPAWAHTYVECASSLVSRGNTKPIPTLMSVTIATETSCAPASRAR